MKRTEPDPDVVALVDLYLTAVRSGDAVAIECAGWRQLAASFLRLLVARVGGEEAQRLVTRPAERR